MDLEGEGVSITYLNYRTHALKLTLVNVDGRQLENIV
jgi:hypothetical protein